MKYTTWGYEKVLFVGDIYKWDGPKNKQVARKLRECNSILSPQKIENKYKKFSYIFILDLLTLLEHFSKKNHYTNDHHFCHWFMFVDNWLKIIHGYTKH